jgi:hypothetical protein
MTLLDATQSLIAFLAGSPIWDFCRSFTQSSVVGQAGANTLGVLLALGKMSGGRRCFYRLTNSKYGSIL